MAKRARRRRAGIRAVYAAVAMEGLESRWLLSGVTFAAPVTYQIGGDSEAVVSAQLTGDGHEDLVTANYNGTVSILLGNGDGTFKTAKTISDGLGSESGGFDNDLAVVDLGNGHPDIVVANGYSGDVSVLLGNGDGTFQAPMEVTVTNTAYVERLLVGDLGNGKQDLVTGNDDGSVSVLIGNGDGTFQSPQTHYIGGDVKSIALADINGDGNPDIIVGDKDTGTAIMLTGYGDGTFGSPETITEAGTDVRSVQVADFNGHPDLAVLNQNGTIDLFLGNGQGTFQSPVQVFSIGNDDNGGFLVGDFNGDGNPDLITGNAAGQVSVLLDNSNGTFQSPVSEFTISNTDSSGSLAADLTGDGEADIVTSYDNSATIKVRLDTTPIAPRVTTTTLSSSQNPSTFGQAVTLTATVTEATLSPNGTVSFLDGTTLLGTATLNTVTNTAAFTTSALPVGADSITADYAGATGFASSKSSPLIQTVNREPTTTTLSAFSAPNTYSSNQPVFGEAVTLTATVTATSGSPGGTVTFVDGSVTLGTGIVNTTTHQATLITTALPLGLDSLTAVYGGATDFLASTNSPVLSETVNLDQTTTKLTPSSNPATFGQAVTLTAAVTTPSSGTPGGTVTFLDGTNVLGTATLSNITHLATFSTNTLAVGDHTLTASYAGATVFAGSTSLAVNEVINPDVTTTTLASSVNPAAFGQTITFTATVTAGTNMPSGVVTFLDGATTTLGTATVNTTNHQATFADSTLAVGPHSIKAVYGGVTGEFGVSSSLAVAETITLDPTTTKVTSSLNPAELGQAVTYTATVTPTYTSSLASPSGTVTFKDGQTTLGTGTISGNTATFSPATVPFGLNSITAVYGGVSGAFSPSTSPALSETINVDPTTTTLAASVNPAATSADFGQPLTLTATVTSPLGSPTGSVMFEDGLTLLGTGTVNASTQEATFTTSTLAVGAHSFTAVYEAVLDKFATSTSAAVKETVTPDPTTTTLTPTPNPADFAQAVTLAAVVTGAYASPTGTVTFDDGTKLLGMGTINATTHTATFVTSTLAVGSHNITASYSGATDFSAGAVSTATETINPDPTTTTLTASPASPILGQTVTFTATVTSPFASPTGTVTFLNNGTTTLGIVAVNASTHVATLATGALAFGPNSITAVYDGAADFTTSTSVPLSETVNLDPTITTLVTSPTSASFGQPVTLTATVTSTIGSPTGTVTFLDGTATLGAAAVNTTTHKAILPTSVMSVGPNSIQAVYGGALDQYATSTSTVVSETITLDPTVTSVTSSLNPAELGQAVTFTATVTPTYTSSLASPSGTVTFKDGTTVLGTGTISGNTATFTTSTLPFGVNAITAVFGGDTGAFAAGTSPALSETITLDPTITTLTAAVNPAATSADFGQPITLTATVTSPLGSPTGSVMFEDGTTLLGTGTVNASTQEATFTTSTLAVGAHSFTAVYEGVTSKFATSTSAAVKESVVADPATTTLTPAPNPADFAQAVTLAAVVTGAYASPTGTVTFDDGTKLLGMGTINATTHTATFVTSTLAVGAHNITASYSGATDFSTGVVSTATETINPDPTTTTLAETPASPMFGQTVTFTATVTSPFASPTGTVTFLNNGTTTLGTGVVNSITHTASLATAALPLGADSITAVYDGSTDFTTSTSPAVDPTVNADPTTTTLTTSPTSASFDQPVTLTATVTSTFGSPSGTVTFLDGTTTLGTAPVNTAHQAIFPTTALNVGLNSITAVYGGASGYATSTSAATSENVSADVTTTTLTASVTNPSAGQSETFTATVNAPLGSPGGTVTFKDGTTTLASGVAVNTTTHQAAYTTSTLAGGSHSVTAVYSGTTGYAGSTSTALSETVSSSATTTSLSFSTTNASVGQVVTLTATVAGSPTITGTVTFTCGGTTLGSAAVNTSGVASISDLVAFSNITATYSGDAKHTGSSVTGTLGGALPTPVSLSGGLQYGIVTAGTGAVAQSGQLVEVNYSGYLTNGTLFDSSLNPGRTPFEFGIGENNVIQGWEEGIPGMKVGETRVLLIPSALGYGTAGSGTTIPANATLIFTVEMLGVDMPRLSVTNGSVPVTPNETPSTSAGTSFGTVKVGSDSSVSTFQLNTNDSSFDLSLTAEPFLSGPDAADFIITQLNSSGQFTVQFKPTATGTRTATVTIPTTDTDVPDFTFTVTGVGD